MSKMTKQKIKMDLSVASVLFTEYHCKIASLFCNSLIKNQKVHKAIKILIAPKRYCLTLFFKKENDCAMLIKYD